MYAEIPDNLLNLSCEDGSTSMPIMTSIHSPIGFIDDAGLFFVYKTESEDSKLTLGISQYAIFSEIDPVEVLATGMEEKSIPIIGNILRAGFDRNKTFNFTHSNWLDKDFISRTFGEPNAIYTLSDILSTDKSDFHGSNEFWVADYEGRITDIFLDNNYFTGYGTTSAFTRVNAKNYSPKYNFSTNKDFDDHDQTVGIFSIDADEEQSLIDNIKSIGTQYWCNGTWNQISGVVRPTSQTYAKYTPYKRIFKNGDGQIAVPRYDLEFFDAQLSIAVKFENYADLNMLSSDGIPFEYNNTTYKLMLNPLPEIKWTPSEPTFNTPILTLKNDQSVLNTYEMTFRGCVEQINKEKTILIGQEDFLRIQSQGEI